MDPRADTVDLPGRDGVAASLPERPPTPGERPDPAPLAESARRQVIRRIFLVAAWAWPPFAALDVFMALVLFPDASLARMLAIRVAVAVVAPAFAMIARQRRLAARRLEQLQWSLAFILGLGVSLLALEVGGLNSSYVHGLSVIIAARAALVPERWSVQLRHSIPIALTFPAVMALGAIASPTLRAAWSRPETVASFASHFVFVLGIVAVGAVGSHAVWAAQQQVYRARRLGRYRLEARIGQGGMSEVWMAWDPEARRKVALKILRSDRAVGGRALLRFEREAMATSRLSDPHTIRLVDFGASDDGIFYLAMEYLPGIDLQEFVRRYGPLPVGRALRLVAQACSSLAEAHAAGIIHRDIKPSNLYLARTSENRDFIKVLDFGIARFLTTDEGIPLTRPGGPPGTPLYMAPELWNGAQADIGTDLYALGATLYFLLAGAPPFEGDLENPLVHAHLDAPVPPIAARRGDDIPPAVEELVARCLAKSPRDRYPSAGALSSALESCAARDGWSESDEESFWALHGARFVV